MSLEIERENYRTSIDGREVDLFALRNAHGMVVKITNWGARIQQILVPDRGGALVDVALGYDSIDAARAGQLSMGAFIGRYANRIANARFTLDGREHLLTANTGAHCLHGGERGSRFVVFEAHQPDNATVVMRYTFADGEEGFPGTLPLTVTYRVTDDNALAVAYQASALDKATVASFTTHGFFNLAGHASGDVLDHTLQVNADRFLPADASSIPTGELRPVAGTPMDLRAPTRLGDRIGADDGQLRQSRGYDHHLVLTRAGAGLSLAATCAHPASGRAMEVWTTEPGMQVYTGNFLEGRQPRDVGKGGALYRPHAGLCLEPSRFPDAPNQPRFPPAVVRPGETYAGETVYRFTTAAEPARL